MEKIPPTSKTTEEKIAEERARWEELGLTPNNTVHPPASIWRMKLQIRAIVNALIESGVISEEVFDRIFSEILLADMQQIRQDHEAKVPLDVPKPTILGPDGRGIKL